MLIAGQIPQGLVAGKNEQIFISCYNNHSALIPAGGSVCFDPAATAAQFLGRAVTRPATANLMHYAGVNAGNDIALGAWGLICCYGVVETCLGVLTSGNSQVPQNASFILAAGAAVTIGTHTPWVTAMATNGTSGRCFIRAM